MKGSTSFEFETPSFRSVQSDIENQRLVSGTTQGICCASRRQALHSLKRTLLMTSYSFVVLVLMILSLYLPSTHQSMFDRYVPAAEDSYFIYPAAMVGLPVYAFQFIGVLRHATRVVEHKLGTTSRKYSTEDADDAVSRARRGSLGTHIQAAVNYGVNILFIHIAGPHLGAWTRTSPNLWLGLALAAWPLNYFMMLSVSAAIVRREREGTRQYIATKLRPQIIGVLCLQFAGLAYVGFFWFSAIPCPSAGADRVCTHNIFNRTYTDNHCNQTAEVETLMGDKFVAGGYLMLVKQFECDNWRAPSPFKSLYTACLACQNAPFELGGNEATLGGLFAIICLYELEFIRGVDEHLSFSTLFGRGGAFDADRLYTWKGVRVAIAVVGVLAAALGVLIGLVGGVLQPGNLQSALGLVNYFQVTCCIGVLVAAVALTIEFAVSKYSPSTDLKIRLPRGAAKPSGFPSVRRMIKSWAATCDEKEVAQWGNQAGEVKDLKIGSLHQAAHGLEALLQIDDKFTFPSNDNGVAAIVAEFQRAAEHELPRAQDDLECLNYVLHQRAGSSPKLFPNSKHPRDSDENGVRADRLNAQGWERRDRGEDAPASTYGMNFDDFCRSDLASKADLKPPEVLALRLYTTAVFISLNSPLRDKDPKRPPHPFPVIILFIKKAIKKMSQIEADSGDEGTVHLFRGMKNLQTASRFLKEGGTESATMSTTSNLHVAAKYSVPATSSLLFAIRTNTCLQRGANLEFLSAFPAEAEFVYPPLTFLRPTGVRPVEIDDIKVGGSSTKFTVVEVEPIMT